MGFSSEASQVKFHTTLELHGKSATGFEVPEEVVTALAAGKRPSVRVTINRHTYRSSVASMGGRFMVGVSTENRAAAGVAAGEVHEVELELDTAPREVIVPADFAAALDAERDARELFDRLSYSDKRWHVEAILGAKRPETRQRRIERSVALLRQGRAR